MKDHCCKCHGNIPVQRCTCKCHNQEDCNYWETLAFIWICDAPDDARRQAAWHRFCDAYPEYGHETSGEFWKRILETCWYKKRGHRHHHHRPEYC